MLAYEALPLLTAKWAKNSHSHRQWALWGFIANYKLGTAGLAMQSFAKKPEAGAATKAEDE